MKLFRQILANAAAEAEGKTYFKDPDILNSVPKITIGTINGSSATVKIGEDAEFSTITTAEALTYINYGGGFSDTA